MEHLISQINSKPYGYVKITPISVSLISLEYAWIVFGKEVS